MKNNPDHQPYDSTLKGLLEAEADGIIPYLVPGVRLKGTPRQAECNVELNRITWFVCLMDRTKTMFDEEKHHIEEVLRMQYQIDPLLTESPTIRSILAKYVDEATTEATAKARISALAEGKAEGKAEGLAEGLQEAILDLISDRLPDIVASQVQQTITTTQDIERLRQFHRQVARAVDEEEVSALLAQCFPPQQQSNPQDPAVMAIAAESEAKGELKGLREAILSLVSERFPTWVVSQVQQTIALAQDAEQLKTFLRQLVRVSDEEEVYTALAQCFPTH